MGWKIICTIQKSPYILKEDSFCSCYSFKIMAFFSYYVAACIIFFMLASGCFPSAFFSTCYLEWSVLVVIMLSFGWRTVAQSGHRLYKNSIIDITVTIWFFHSCFRNEEKRENILFVYFIPVSCLTWFLFPMPQVSHWEHTDMWPLASTTLFLKC